MPECVVEAAGTRLFVREWGEPDGSPLLFWHALGDHTGLQVGEAAPILAGEYGLRVIALDAPGFGESPPLGSAAGYLTPALARLVVAALDRLELGAAAFMGSSWGATVGVHTAAHHPDRIAGLVLLDGGYHDLPESNETLEELKGHWRTQPGFRYASWNKLFEEVRYFGRWSPGLEEAIRSAMREETGEVVSRIGPDLYATVIWAVREASASSAFERLAAGGVPVLLLAATEPPDDGRDQALGTFRLAVPHADVRELSGRHHWLLEEAPEEVAHIAGGWLIR